MGSRQENWLQRNLIEYKITLQVLDQGKHTDLAAEDAPVSTTVG
jgi:phosphodiesterase/alkaline phosphatase D-like protein